MIKLILLINILSMYLLFIALLILSQSADKLAPTP